MSTLRALADPPTRLTLVTSDGGVTNLDPDGCLWVEFEIDELAGEEPGECSICNAETRAGWLCLDCAGEEMCASHVHVLATEAVSAWPINRP